MDSTSPLPVTFQLQFQILVSQIKANVIAEVTEAVKRNIDEQTAQLARLFGEQWTQKRSSPCQQCQHSSCPGASSAVAPEITQDVSTSTATKVEIIEEEDLTSFVNANSVPNGVPNSDHLAISNPWPQSVVATYSQSDMQHQNHEFHGSTTTPANFEAHQLPVIQVKSDPDVDVPPPEPVEEHHQQEEVVNLEDNDSDCSCENCLNNITSPVAPLEPTEAAAALPVADSQQPPSSTIRLLSRFSHPAPIPPHIRHRRIHCPVPQCTNDSGFPTRHKLLRHLRYHVNIKPFRCIYPGCTPHYEAGQRGDLIKHIRRRHLGAAVWSDEERPDEERWMKQFVAVDAVQLEEMERHTRQLAAAVVDVNGTPAGPAAGPPSGS